MPLVKTHFGDSELHEDLKQRGRTNFSYDGSKALLNYLEELADETGENIEYDPIAFCCDFTEFSNNDLETLLDQVNLSIPKFSQQKEPRDFEDWEEWRDALIEELNDETIVIDFDDGIVIANY